MIGPTRQDFREKLSLAASIVSVETIELGGEPVDLVTLRSGQVVAITADTIYAYAGRHEFDSGIALGNIRLP